MPWPDVLNRYQALTDRDVDGPGHRDPAGPRRVER